MKLAMPDRRHNARGELRRVGVELEMNGLTLEAVGELVAQTLGLTVASRGRYERVLSGDPAGDWGVELDFNLLKRLGREERRQGNLSEELAESAEEVLKWLAETLVPVELVSPPLPLNRLEQVETLIERLRRAGALGTSDRLVNAFGMQFNPEVPDTEAGTLTAYLKAFCCLYDWLYERADINLSRQVTHYIDPYPTAYARQLVAADYWPSRSRLIDDYLAHNPTRNRALDMLPLFAYLDEARVRAKVEDPLIKARPTFHYRLPDCEIHRPDWSMALAWNDWVEVERLAADEHRLAACCRAYHDFLSDPLDRWLGDWVKELDRRWLVR